MTAEMLSPRTAIRRKACDLLRAALPQWSERLMPERVYDSRSIPLTMKRLPAVLVYTRNERLEATEGHADPGLRLRVLDLAVEIVTGEESLTDFLCAAVEAILDNNETLGHLAQGTQLQRVSLERDSDGEATVIAARMEFEVAYRTRPLSLPVLDASGYRGRVPAHPADANAEAGDTVILGMTPSLAELEDEKNTLIPHSIRLLTSTAPFIGPEHESRYEPAPTS
jgi:hypothetical protein